MTNIFYFTPTLIIEGSWVLVAGNPPSWDVYKFSKIFSGFETLSFSFINFRAFSFSFPNIWYRECYEYHITQISEKPTSGKPIYYEQNNIATEQKQ